MLANELALLNVYVCASNLKDANFLPMLLTNEKQDDQGGVLWEPSDNEHHYLRQVKFYRFRMRQGDVALAGLLMARAPFLQTMAFFRGFVHSPPDWITRYVEAHDGWSTEQQSAITRRLEACNTFGARLEFRS